MRNYSSTERQGIGIAMAAFERLSMAFRSQDVHDYGIDAHIELLEDGIATGRLLAVQIKTGPSYFKETNEIGIWFRFDTQHKNYWVNHALPVIVVLCDLAANQLYWERIADDTVISTGGEWKVLVPRSQTVNESSAIQLRDAATKVVSVDLYNVIQSSDVSHGTAKRYSVDVVLIGTRTKSEIASIIRQVTREYIGERYYRNQIVEDRWGDMDAHVVWICIYASPQDFHNTNWICHSQWIDPSLPLEFAPTRIIGENIGYAIIVEWSTHYHERARLLAGLTISKKEFLTHVDRIITKIDTLHQPLVLSQNGEMSHDVVQEICQRIELQIRALYDEGTRIGVAPMECAPLNRAFQETIASADNIVLPFSEQGKHKWSPTNRFWLCNRALASFINDRNKLVLERQRIR